MVNPVKKVRVLIVDDSPLIRELLIDILSKDNEIEIAGEAANGKEAVKAAKEIKPDIIIMDIQMPEMDGFEATEEIMAYSPAPVLIFSSAINKSEAYSSFKAIGLGALDVLEKPEITDPENMSIMAESFIRKVKLLSKIPVITHIRGKQRRETVSKIVKQNIEGEIIEKKFYPSMKTVELKKGKYKVLGIGCSTGGPIALKTVLGELPRDFPVPVLITQHIAEGFIEGLAEWLNGETKLKVMVARHGMKAEPGYVYFAPNGVQMLINSNMEIELSKMLPPWCGHKPSVNYLFRSIGDSFGKEGVLVILTGMGEDGAEGMVSAKENGTLTIAQDKDSSLIYGMPKIAVEKGGAKLIMSLNQIPQYVTDIVKGNF